MENNELKEAIEQEKEYRVNKQKVLTNAISISIGIVFSVIVLFALYTIIKPQLSSSSTLTSEVFTQEQLQRLEEAAKIIEEDYLYDYDTDKMMDGAIEGMVNSLENPYTYYETEEE